MYKIINYKFPIIKSRNILIIKIKYYFFKYFVYNNHNI